jgi:AraC family ethanolamine operon transcriptional activator
MEGTSSERHRAIVKKLDELIRELPPSLPLYNLDLARLIDTSVRTLQIASRSITGVSLQKYMRAQRLSRVRWQLSRGTVSVKAAALDNGFWHLGEFSRIYTRTFGEMPSQTRAGQGRLSRGASLSISLQRLTH